MKQMSIWAVVALAASVSACSRSTEKGAEVSQAETKPVPLPFTAETVRLSVLPVSGSSADQIFTMSVDKNATANPTLLGLLINREVTGNGACYVFYDLATNKALLANDSGIGSNGIGSDGTVSNKQCTLLADGTKSRNDGSIGADFHIRFRKTFAGPKKLSLTAQDSVGNLVGPLVGGEWIVP